MVTTYKHYKNRNLKLIDNTKTNYKKNRTKKLKKIKRKYITHNRDDVYAVYYHDIKTMYYNINFSKGTKLIIYK